MRTGDLKSSPALLATVVLAGCARGPRGAAPPEDGAALAAETIAARANGGCRAVLRFHKMTGMPS